MTGWIERTFELKKAGTNLRREIIGGTTTFFAMAYIIFVNPGMLSETGMDYTAVMVATCVASAIGSALTAFLANLPFAQAPGMGLNAFFTYTVCLGMGYSWQQGLTIVLISGVLFLLIALSPLRSKVIASIPLCLKHAISAGVGLFIALIGFLNAGIVTANGNLLDLSRLTSGAPLLALIGLFITALLMAWKVKGAIFLGIVAGVLIAFPMGVTKLPEVAANASVSLMPTLFQLDFGGLLTNGVLPLVTAIVTFTICDMFDTVGALVGTAGNAEMLDEEGNLLRGDRVLIADAIATCTGALVGTSTVTTYIESSTGISDGARTGFSSLVVALLFMLAIFLAPIAGMIPEAATAPALIIVGMLMIGNAAKIDWSDMENALPCFLTLAVIPFGYSISDGIGLGCISYTLIKLCRGKFSEIPALMYVLSALFVLMFIL